MESPLPPACKPLCWLLLSPAGFTSIVQKLPLHVPPTAAHDGSHPCGPELESLPAVAPSPNAPTRPPSLPRLPPSAAAVTVLPESASEPKPDPPPEPPHAAATVATRIEDVRSEE